MPVTIKLFDLVQIKDTQPLWPAEFQSLIKALEDDRSNSTLWGAVADWCDENDEPELAFGFRYIHKRPKVQINLDSECWDDRWMFRRVGSELPNSIHKLVEGIMTQTLAGLIAILVQRINEVRKELE